MRLKTPLCLLIALWSMIALATCSPPAPQGASPDRPHEVTLLYTNDLESAYDPIPAFWRDDLDHVGGVAQLATLIDEVRAEEKLSFLLDAGDIFTGTLICQT